MASGKSGSGVKPKWPSREAHLSTGSESDVNLTVHSNPPLQSSTKKSPSSRPQEQQTQQVVQHRPQVAPPSNRPKKEITFDNWNPMEEDYNDKSFNSYNRGPAAGISGTNSSRPGKTRGKFSLFVGNIPTEMTEEGLSNLFSHVCDIQHVTVCRPRDENSDTTFGFVEVPSIKDGEEAIKRLDAHVIRNRRLKVSFKREKSTAPIEVPNAKSDSPEEWDPPNPGGKPIKMTLPGKQSVPSGKRRSTSSGKTSSSNSEADDGGSKATRKPAQPRRLEDRYGSSLKPKSSGEESVNKSPRGPARNQQKSPQQAQEPPPVDNKLTHSPLQALLQKMRSPNKSSPETDGVQPGGQNVAGVKSSPGVKGQAGRGIGREIDFDKSVEATPGSGTRQSLAEKLHQAGIMPKSQPLDSSHTNSNLTGKTEQEGVKSHPAISKTAPKPLLPLPVKAVDNQAFNNSAGNESDLQERGQGDNPSRSLVAKHNPQDGLLGRAPGLLSQPYGQAKSPSHCPECSAREHHESDRHGFHSCHHHHHLPQHHHHHHGPQPRFPCSLCEGSLEEDEPCQVCHHHPLPKPHRPLMHPQYHPGPRYGPDPSYGPRPPYGGYYPYGRGPAHPLPPDYPMQHGYYEGRDMYQMGYPQANLGSAGYRNSRFVAGRSKHPPSYFPPKSPNVHSAPVDGPGDQTTKQLPKSSSETKKNSTGKGIASEPKEPIGKASTAKVDEPAAAELGLSTNKQFPGKNPAAEHSQKAPPTAQANQEGQPAAAEKSPAGKSTATGGEGQRSLHKESKQGQRGSLDPKPCVHCGTPGLLRCSNCKCTYCSKECQKDNWPTHKHQCHKVNSSKGSSTASSVVSVDSFPTKQPRKSTELLHGGTEGQFMARNLPYETPENPEMRVLVTEVVDPSELWVQLVQERSMEGFSNIVEMLHSVYTDPAQAAQLSYKAMVGGVCAVPYSQDGHWYRAEVVSVNDAMCTVRLIDFGNMDVVAVDSLRRLQDAMLKLPKQALKCFLSDIKPPQGTWSPEATQMLKSLINKDEDCTRAKFRGQGAKGQEIELYSAEDDTKTLSSILISAGLAEAISSSVPSKPTSDPVTVTPDPSPSLGWVLDSLAVGSHLDVIVSHVDSPGCFCAYLFESALALLELQQEMNAHYAGVPPKAGFRPGKDVLCAAKYNVDDNWYRAIIVEPASPPLNTLQITFIDHGNSETINLDDCRPLEAQFFTLPRQAIPCGLAGVQPNVSDWPEEMTAAFKEWLADGQARVGIKAKSDSQLQVEIFLPHREDDPGTGISFNALLQHSGFGNDEEAGVDKKSNDPVSANEMPTSAKEAVVDDTRRGLPVTEPPQGEVHGFVTVVNDPGDFYLQVDSDQNREAFQSLSEHLNTRYALQDFAPYKPSIGEYCAVIYSDDAWYRALVVDKVAPESAFKVLLVDYGEVGVLPADKIRQLEDRFYKQPAMALHCSLTCVMAPSSNAGTWNEAATKHFKEKALNQLCQVIVVKCEDGKCDVELLYPGKNMNELPSVKRDLIQKGWAVPKGAPSSNQVHASGSGDRQVANPNAATKGSTGVGRSPTPPPTNPTVPHSPSTNQSVCSLPAPKVPAEDFFGLVTVVSDRGDVYIQVMSEENAEATESLTLNLYEHYSQAPQRPLKANIGEFCAVKYREDDSWCRGKVVGCLTQDSTLEVLFVDYGNTEIVSSEDVMKLQEKFLGIPICALRCRLNGVTAPSTGVVWPSEAVNFLKKEILEKACKVHVCKNDGEVCQVELQYSNDDVSWFSVNKELIDRGLAKPITTQSHSPGPSGDHPLANQEQLNKSHPVLTNESVPQLQAQAAQNPSSGVQEASANQRADVRSGGQVEAAPANKLLDSEPPPAEFTGVLTSVNHPCDFYLQIKNEDYIQLSQLLREELNQHYPRKDEPPHVPRVGKLCAAMYSADEEWYRALALVEVAPKQAFKVMFVDYGNCEVVPLDRLQKLEGIFLEVPRLSHHCCLSGVMAPSGDDHRQQSAEAALFIVTELIEKGKDCRVKLMKHDAKMCEVELHYSSDDGTQSYNLKEELIRRGLARPAAMATAQNKENRLLARTLQRATLPTDANIAVTVTDVVSPQEFYCQMIIREEIDKLKSLMEDIAAAAGNRRLTAPPAIGDLCLAKFTEDDVWYRAEILKINQAKQRALVYYVDFGNKEPLPWSRLLTVDSKFAKLPMQAIRCGFQGVSPDTAADEKTRLALRNLMTDHTNAKRMLTRMCGMSGNGTTSLVTLVDEESGTDIAQLVKDHAMAGASPGPTTKSPLPVSATSPAGPVVSPKAATSDPAKREALKREMELKKRQLEEQIEAQRRELAEVEQLRASLEQGL
ncbi:tudor domain-containing protein 6-like [Patiria miniata]|uniref:Tudor domain-containing protein 1 n=1 Tax=Patiria miniata TaxID=46514 RepID=A0A914B531_PATMI|nr:tudor domain-containing protein 6-like [Patiria miniata]